MSSHIGNLFIPGLVALVFAFARKYMKPVAAEDSFTHIPVEELNKKFKNTQWAVGLGMPVIGIVFALAFHALFANTNIWLAHRDHALYYLYYQPAVWWFFPGFGGVALCWEIYLQVWMLFGNREEALLYNYWSSIKSGFNARKVLGLMSIFVVVPIGVASILALPMHASLGDTDIRDFDYAKLTPQIYRYTDARRMTLIDGMRLKDGTLSPRAGIVLDFADGRRWSTADWGDFKNTVDPELYNLLVKKTGLELQYAQTEADIPK